MHWQEARLLDLLCLGDRGLVSRCERKTRAGKEVGKKSKTDFFFPPVSADTRLP